MNVINKLGKHLWMTGAEAMLQGTFFDLIFHLYSQFYLKYVVLNRDNTLEFLKCIISPRRFNQLHFENGIAEPDMLRISLLCTLKFFPPRWKYPLTYSGGREETARKQENSHFHLLRTLSFLKQSYWALEHLLIFYYLIIFIINIYF